MALDMTDKQLYSQAKLGRKITFYFSDFDEPLTGYLAGLDLDYYFVLVLSKWEDDDGKTGGTNVDQYVVRRDAVPQVYLHRDRTYDTEPLRSEMDKIIQRFRDVASRKLEDDGKTGNRR